MIIDGQQIEVTQSYVKVSLKKPFWSAWKQYGWTEGDEGFGINEKIVQRAKRTNKKILITTTFGMFEITPDKAEKMCRTYLSYFVTHGGVRLFIIPRSSCKKIPQREEQTVNTRDIIMNLTDEQRAKIRAILHK